MVRSEAATSWGAATKNLCLLGRGYFRHILLRILSLIQRLSILPCTMAFWYPSFLSFFFSIIMQFLAVCFCEKSLKVSGLFGLIVWTLYCSSQNGRNTVFVIKSILGYLIFYAFQSYTCFHYNLHNRKGILRPFRTVPFYHICYNNDMFSFWDLPASFLFFFVAFIEERENPPLQPSLVLNYLEFMNMDKITLFFVLHIPLRYVSFCNVVLFQ